MSVQFPVLHLQLKEYHVLAVFISNSNLDFQVGVKQVICLENRVSFFKVLV